MSNPLRAIVETPEGGPGDTGCSVPGRHENIQAYRKMSQEFMRIYLSQTDIWKQDLNRPRTMLLRMTVGSFFYARLAEGKDNPSLRSYVLGTGLPATTCPAGNSWPPYFLSLDLSVVLEQLSLPTAKTRKVLGNLGRLVTLPRGDKS